MLHGNLLLHGWIIGDATFYTFELPLYSITEIFFGLHSVTVHLGAALTYLIVAASAVAVARMDSRGVSTAARCGVVIAVLAAPLLTTAGVYTLLELPDHTGTAAILLVCFLLIDRAPVWRLTPLAALRDPDRRSARRRHRPLRGGADDPGRLCLSRPGHSEPQ